MFRILLLSLAITAFISCGADHKPKAESTTPPDDNKIKVSLPFAGSWISESYLKDITAHQSPRKAQVGSTECFVQIPATTLLPATMVYNFHEAITDLVPIINKGTYELWDKQNDTIANLKYPIEILAENKLKIANKIFVKINPDISGGQPRILEEILFKGTYQLKKGEDVEFKSNGQVSGLGKYKYYAPMIDYFDAGRQIDQVGLGETPEKLENFGFKFKKNGLDLFEIKCKSYDTTDKKRCVDVAFGKKVYAFEKVSSPKK